MENNFKVAVVGTGAREARMIRSLLGPNVEILSIGDKINPQIVRMASWNVASDNLLQIARLIEYWEADMVLIGSEKYLGPIDGMWPKSIVDMLEKIGIPVAAPAYLPSRVELDKAWLIELMMRYDLGVFLPESIILEGASFVGDAFKAINEFGDVAIKPASLTGGKGVKVMGVQLQTQNEAKIYARELLLKGEKIIIQRKICGHEFTLQGFVYKSGLVVFAPPVMDFKLLYEDGACAANNPNTGGMGSIGYSDGLLPFVNEVILRQAQGITKKIIVSTEEETGICYRGMISAQFMVSEDGKLYLVEINARLGDSEAMNILPLLPKGAFLKICQEMVSDEPVCSDVIFEKKASVVVYAVPIGYPGSSQPVKIELGGKDLDAQFLLRCATKDKKKILIDEADSVYVKTDLNEAFQKVQIFFAGIEEDDKGNLFTTGSRAIAIAAFDDNIEQAAETVQKSIAEIFEQYTQKLHWRRDIGKKLIEKFYGR